ncbi:hypothetical protein [Paenibacillus sp. YN15]|uniref:hypothetical protein n=1 Tax=Paenibacillus sp. YN15 TaxID=1742774 RepID=UPI0011BDA55C|nr:hypothetical protein [Paenibacillus sp. YN15]
MMFKWLKEIGINLKPTYNTEYLFEHYTQEEMEQDPYVRLLVYASGLSFLDYQVYNYGRNSDDKRPSLK